MASLLFFYWSQFFVSGSFVSELREKRNTGVFQGLFESNVYRVFFLCKEEIDGEQLRVNFLTFRKAFRKVGQLWFQVSASPHLWSPLPQDVASRKQSANKRPERMIRAPTLFRTRIEEHAPA